MELFYRKVGEGRPLVFLHGLFGSGDNWQTLASKLKGFEVWLPDLRNHGSSPWVEQFSVEDLATDLFDFLEKHHLEQPVLAGHSLGGKAVMEFALRWPEKLAGLVVVDMAPRAYAPQYSGFVEALAQLNLDTISSRTDAQTTLSKSITDKPTLQFLLKNLVPNDQGGWRWRLNLEVLHRQYDKIWVALETTSEHGQPRGYFGPSLFVTGGNSDYVRPADGDLIHQLFPSAEIHSIHGAGHWLHAEKPAEVLEVLQNWLLQHRLAEMPALGRRDSSIE